MTETIPRILFVDDNEDLRFMVKTWLSMHGYEVKTAESLASGLHQARSEVFDLYLLDADLPDGRGRELSDRIREFDRATPIVFYSGESPARRGKSVKCDLQDYVMKPGLEDLRKAIFRAINTRHA